jgi:hypothetical protein
MDIRMHDSEFADITGTDRYCTAVFSSSASGGVSVIDLKSRQAWSMNGKTGQ